MCRPGRASDFVRAISIEPAAQSSFTGWYNDLVPYQLQKSYIVVKGQKFVSPGAEPQRLPVCDRCGELAASHASVYTELAADKVWKWFSYPRFSCESEAFMGCHRHPVSSKLHFLDGSVEPFIRLPVTRWQGMTEWKGLFVATVLAVVFAVVVAVLLHFVGW